MSWVMAVASRFLQVKHFVLMDFTTLEAWGIQKKTLDLATVC